MLINASFADEHNQNAQTIREF